MRLFLQLNLIAKSRLDNIGKCFSCKYQSRNLSCIHSKKDILLITDDCNSTIPFGTKEICPLWEPLEIDVCWNVNEDHVIHGPYRIRDGCEICKQSTYSHLIASITNKEV